MQHRARHAVTHQHAAESSTGCCTIPCLLVQSTLSQGKMICSYNSSSSRSLFSRSLSLCAKACRLFSTRRKKCLTLYDIQRNTWKLRTSTAVCKRKKFQDYFLTILCHLHKNTVKSETYQNHTYFRIYITYKYRNQILWSQAFCVKFCRFYTSVPDHIQYC